MAYSSDEEVYCSWVQFRAHGNFTTLLRSRLLSSLSIPDSADPLSQIDRPIALYLLNYTFSDNDLSLINVLGAKNFSLIHVNSKTLLQALF